MIFYKNRDKEISKWWNLSRAEKKSRFIWFIKAIPYNTVRYLYNSYYDQYEKRIELLQKKREMLTFYLFYYYFFLSFLDILFSDICYPVYLGRDNHFNLVNDFFYVLIAIWILNRIFSFIGLMFIDLYEYKYIRRLLFIWFYFGICVDDNKFFIDYSSEVFSYEYTIYASMVFFYSGMAWGWWEFLPEELTSNIFFICAFSWNAKSIFFETIKEAERLLANWEAVNGKFVPMTWKQTVNFSINFCYETLVMYKNFIIDLPARFVRFLNRFSIELK